MTELPIDPPSCVLPCPPGDHDLYNNALGNGTTVEREYVHQDTGTAMINVNTYFTASTVYAASDSASAHTFGVADNRDHWYGGYIDGAHIARVVSEYNPTRPAGAPAASSNPADYVVAFISVGPEWRVHNPDVGLCHFGVNVHDMALIAYVP